MDIELNIEQILISAETNAKQESLELGDKTKFLSIFQKVHQDLTNLNFEILNNFGFDFQYKDNLALESFDQLKAFLAQNGAHFPSLAAIANDLNWEWNLSPRILATFNYFDVERITNLDSKVSYIAALENLLKFPFESWINESSDLQREYRTKLAALMRSEYCTESIINELILRYKQVLQKSIDDFLNLAEIKARDLAVYENGELIEFADEIEEVLEGIYENLVDLDLEVLKSGNIWVKLCEILPAILTNTNLSHFENYLESKKNSYPNLYEFVTSGLDWTWAPFAEAIEKTQKPETLSVIENEKEIAVLISQITNFETYYHWMSAERAESALDRVRGFQRNQRLSLEQAKSLEVTADYLQNILERKPAAQIYQPKILTDADGPTALLETEILNWIHDFYFSEFFSETTIYHI